MFEGIWCHIKLSLANNLATEKPSIFKYHQSRKNQLFSMSHETHQSFDDGLKLGAFF